MRMLEDLENNIMKLTRDNNQRKKMTDIAMRYHAHDKKYERKDYIEFIVSLVLVIVAVFALRQFAFEPVRVDGNSMFPTLHNNERMFVEKITYMLSTPQRGDIVICYYPMRGETTFVKRVIATEGEVISVNNGAVYIDGERLDESEYWDDFIIGEYDEYTIPKGHVFVMGDNRNDSGDSRDRTVGPIPITRILGRVVGVAWPLNAIREV